MATLDLPGSLRQPGGSLGTGRHADADLRAGTARAMDRVLAAEHEAAARIAQAEQEGREQLEQARQDALVRINASLERIASWQQAHAVTLQARLEALRAAAGFNAAAQAPPDEAALACAVERLACQLTGVDGEPQHGPA